MTVRLVGYHDVLTAVSPAAAMERVRDGFIRHAAGEWRMPPKVYVDSPGHGDFRAMPASGSGIAVLKWVTSFPLNPERGLPTVTGVVLASDATTGELKAIVDGRSVTALRTGAAAAVATAALAPDARTVGIIGCGLHGRWAARCLKEAGFGPGVCNDADENAARELAGDLGWSAGTRAEAAACDVVTLVTPGNEYVVEPGDLRPGTHINALGADGPGKAEMDPAAVAECRVFCDEWIQASHGGEIRAAVEQELLTRDDVVELGAVLSGSAPGRTAATDVTLFDSTGLAIQDLAIVIAVLDHIEGIGTPIQL
jgi:alanine dehydrogenase